MLTNVFKKVDWLPKAGQPAVRWVVLIALVLLGQNRTAVAQYITRSRFDLSYSERHAEEMGDQIRQAVQKLQDQGVVIPGWELQNTSQPNAPVGSAFVTHTSGAGDSDAHSEIIPLPQLGTDSGDGQADEDDPSWDNDDRGAGDDDNFGYEEEVSSKDIFPADF